MPGRHLILSIVAGGAAAAEYAALFRRRVSQLALITPYGLWPEGEPLADWLRHPGKPLSLRATNGFLERTTRSSLRFPPRFLELIRQHQRRVSADARG